MKLTFLCTKHRAWLLSQPEQAIHCHVNFCEKGWNLYFQGQWKEALPYIGCAFESAEILLTTHAMLPFTALDWYLHALEGLIQTLKKLELVQGCGEIYQDAIQLLKCESAISKDLKATFDVQIERLNTELHDLNTCRPERFTGGPDNTKYRSIVLH